MQLFIRTVTGATAVVETDASSTVGEIKSLLHNKGGPLDQRLIFQGKQLEDALTLGDYNVYNESTLHAALRLRGGAAAAAARANVFAQKRKQAEAMKKMLEDHSDEPVFFKPGFVLEARPKCTEEMSDELRELLKKKMNDFRKHMRAAIDSGDLDELEELEHSYERLIWNGFVAGKGFYPMKHDVTVGVVHEQVAPEPEPEEDEDEGGNWYNDGPAAFAKSVNENNYFSGSIIIAICIAGILVGMGTYLDCGQEKTPPVLSCHPKLWNSQDNICLPHGTNESACQAASCCFVPAYDGTTAPSLIGYSLATPHRNFTSCHKQGPMPECYTGDTASSVLHVLEFIDTIILFMFTIECLVKFVAEGTTPWKYFYDNWNVFDFIVVALCWQSLLNGGGGAVAVLRLLRLLRLLKLLHAIEDLQIILQGLAAGFQSIGYIMILLMLVFYLFGIMCIMLFRDNDPVHFRSLHIAMLTLFRMSTMEDWTDVMYINMYGCMNYGYMGGAYCHDPANCLVKDNCTEENSEGYGYFAAVFFIVFIVISGLVVMSLFVGVITTSMQTASDEAAEERVEKNQAETQAAVEEECEDRKAKGIKVDRLSLAVFLEQTSKEDRGEHHNACVEKYFSLGDQMEDLKNSKPFKGVIIGCILVAAVVIGMQQYRSNDVDPMLSILTGIDNVILAIFCVECVVKIIAEKGKPWLYFTDAWNVFDFGVVAACLLAPLMMNDGEGDAIAVLRLMRLMRVMKLFNSLKQLQIILSGLTQGLKSTTYIAALLLLMYYVFAIVALFYFRENDPIHWPNIGTSFVTLFRCSTMEDWTDVMYVAMYGCDVYSYGDGNQWPRCENNEGQMWAALYFLAFILLSALIMLNLVIGTICSSMAEADDAHELNEELEHMVSFLEEATMKQGKKHQIPGIPAKVILAWIKGFTKMDCNDTGMGQPRIKKDHLDLSLDFLGELETLSKKRREHLLVMANHTLPIGQITMKDFLTALASDVMDEHRRLKHKGGDGETDSLVDSMELEDELDGLDVPTDTRKE